MRLPFIAPPSHAFHPLLEKIIFLAPDRTCVISLLGTDAALPEEEQLQQNGYDLFQMTVSNLPTDHQMRGDYLEAHFRPLLDTAIEMAMALTDRPAHVPEASYVQTYIAVQNLIGAQKAAMDLYCRVQVEFMIS
ncbi:hypothetical protein [Acetobacter sp. DmW_136]|uniref:hypothetical protein n=1 Tax=Acetobacter sp. DmW_136 TaxID=2591091 RepID=UPI0018776127|nr:hypothetical protein [Acetobacter sp. DmW_136]